MRAAAQFLLLTVAWASASASESNYAHHFYSNQTGHIIPRAESVESVNDANHFNSNFTGHIIPREGDINDAADHMHPRAIAFICHGVQDIVLSDGEEALLESPGYPNDYPNRKKCGWNVKSSDGSNIDISCPRFELQEPNRAGVCKSDYLSINGFKFCGGESVSATINSAKIRFRSNGAKVFRGFKCRADALAPTTIPPVTPVNSTSACVCGKSNEKSRIVGGNNADMNEYPWLAALVEKRSKKVFCGGTLINSRFVLTAAHCTDGLHSMETHVLLGNHKQKKNDKKEKRVNVKRIINHPYYNQKNMDKDFALLELSEDLDLVKLAPEIAPACLPAQTTPENKYDDVDAVVSGWGALSSGGKQPNILQEVVVKTMTNNACNKKYNHGDIQTTMLCAANDGKDSCQGDSGGPLVTKEDGAFSLIGVVSWGYDCASPDYPGVYARVTSELDWIKRESRTGVTCSGKIDA